MRSIHSLPTATALLLAGCAAGAQDENRILAPAGEGLPVAAGVFVPLNEERTGMAPSGSVTLHRDDSTLLVELDARGLSPGTHLAHIHGFAVAEPGVARCPTMAADANRDGYVDLIETRDRSGVTMVPFTNDPVSLDLHGEGYPTAGPDGAVSYRQRIDEAALEPALREKFGTPAAPTRRVVYIHGVPEGVQLPNSVRSLEGVPARVTLPVACAELNPL